MFTQSEKQRMAFNIQKLLFSIQFVHAGRDFEHLLPTNVIFTFKNSHSTPLNLYDIVCFYAPCLWMLPKRHHWENCLQSADESWQRISSVCSWFRCCLWPLGATCAPHSNSITNITLLEELSTAVNLLQKAHKCPRASTPAADATQALQFPRVHYTYSQHAQ